MTVLLKEKKTVLQIIAGGWKYCTVFVVCHDASALWLCVTAKLQALAAADMSISNVSVFGKRAHTQQACDLEHPHYHGHHHNILQPASLPSADITDAQSILFATDFTDVTGIRNFKSQLRCKVKEGQVASLALINLCKCKGDGFDFSPSEKAKFGEMDLNN